MNVSTYKIQKSWSEWMRSRLPSDADYFFLTLTLKQGIKRKDGTWEPLTREAVDSELLFFQMKINQSVFGSAHQRYGKSLKWIDCTEGGERDGPRLHRHLCIEKPDRLTVDEFRKLLTETWSGSRWAHREMRIEPAKSRDAVLKYITKTGGDALCLSTLTL